MAGSGSWRRGQAQSQHLRDRVLGAPELTARDAAERFAVSPSYVAKGRARLRDAGEHAARPQCNHVPPRLAGHEQALGARVAATPDATLDELQAWLATEQAASVGRTALWKGLARLGLTLKKSTSGPRNRIAPTSPRLGRTGPQRSPRWTRPALCSSTRPGQQPP